MENLTSTTGIPNDLIDLPLDAPEEPQSNIGQGQLPSDLQDLPSDFKGLFGKLSSDFQTQFKRPFRVTTQPGAPGYKNLHKNLHNSNAADIGGSDLSDDEANWLVQQGSKYGLNVKDYRKNWKQIGGTAPHIHIDDDFGGVQYVQPTQPQTQTQPQEVSPTQLPNDLVDLPVEETPQQPISLKPPSPMKSTRQMQAQSQFKKLLPTLNSAAQEIGQFEALKEQAAQEKAQSTGYLDNQWYKTLQIAQQKALEIQSKYGKHVEVGNLTDWPYIKPKGWTITKSGLPASLFAQAIGAKQQEPEQSLEEFKHQVGDRQIEAGLAASAHLPARFNLQEAEKQREESERYQAAAQYWHDQHKQAQVAIGAKEDQGQLEVDNTIRHAVVNALTGLGETTWNVGAKALELSPIGQLVDQLRPQTRDEVRHFLNGINQAASDLRDQNQGDKFFNSLMYQTGELAPKMIAPGGIIGFAAAEGLDALGHNAPPQEVVKQTILALGTARLAHVLGIAATRIPSLTLSHTIPNAVESFGKQWLANSTAPALVHYLTTGETPDKKQAAYDLAFGALFSLYGARVQDLDPNKPLTEFEPVLGEMKSHLVESGKMKPEDADEYVRVAYANAVIKARNQGVDPTTIAKNIRDGAKQYWANKLEWLNKYNKNAPKQLGTNPETEFDSGLKEAIRQAKSQGLEVTPEYIASKFGLSIEKADAIINEVSPVETQPQPTEPVTSQPSPVEEPLANGMTPEERTTLRDALYSDEEIAAMTPEQARQKIASFQELYPSTPQQAPEPKPVAPKKGDLFTHTPTGNVYRFAGTAKSGELNFDIVRPDGSIGARKLWLPDRMQDFKPLSASQDTTTQPEQVTLQPEVKPDLPGVVYRSDNGAALEVLDRVGEAYRVRNERGRTYLIHQNATFIPEQVTPEGKGERVLNKSTNQPLTVLGTRGQAFIVKNGAGKIYTLHKNMTIPASPDILSKESQTIPETPHTITAQMNALAEGRKGAVLITPGETMPVLPDNMVATSTPVGTFIHSPSISPRDITEAVATDNYGGLLGNVAPKPESGEPSVIVTARDSQGRELQSAVVPPEYADLQDHEFRQIYPHATIVMGGEDLSEAVIQHRVESQPEWLKQNLNVLTSGAEKSGLADQVEELSAQRLTAKEVAQKLNTDVDTVRAIRANRNIPSMDDATEFENWLSNRSTSAPQPEQRGLTPAETEAANKARLGEDMVAVGPEDLGISAEKGPLPADQKYGAKIEIPAEEMIEKGMPTFGAPSTKPEVLSKEESKPTPQSIGLDLRNKLREKHGTDLPVADLITDIPSFHVEMKKAGLDAQGQLEAFRTIGFVFKDPVQMIGTIRGTQSELGRIPRLDIKYKSAGRLIDYRVLGRFPGGEKIMVMTPDSTVKIIQSPLGQTGNTRVKGEVPKAIFGKIPTIKWQEIGMQGDAWPTKAEIHRVNPAIDDVLDLTDDELQEHFPEVWRRVQEAQEQIGNAAGKEFLSIAYKEGDGDDNDSIQESRDRLHELFNANIRPNNTSQWLYDTAVVVGNDILKLHPERDEWEQRLTERLGEDIRPHLANVWDAINGRAPMFFSPLERVLKTEIPNKAQAAQIKGIIRKAGVSDDEMKWTGFDEFLKDKAMKEQPVTRQEALDFFQKNKVVITERVFVDDPKLQQTLTDALSSDDKLRDISDRLKNEGFVVEQHPEDGNELGFIEEDSEELFRDSSSLRESWKDSPRPDLNEFLDRVGGLIDQFTNRFNEVSGGRTKFTSHTTPGGINNREITLSLPTRLYRLTQLDSNKASLNDVSRSIYNKEFASLDKDQAREVGTLFAGKDDYNVPGGHQYGVPEADINRIAIIRVNDRVGSNNERILHVDEFQDDLQNEIQAKKNELKDRERKRGEYLEYLKQSKEEVKAPDQWSALAVQQTKQELDRLQSLLPFRGKSHELAMKYALGYAINHGYDMLTWATGRQVADRYSLAKYIDKLRYQPRSAGDGFFIYGYKNGEQILRQDVPTVQLEATVGKEVAQKILNNSGSVPDDQGKIDVGMRDLLNLDLKVGGEGKLLLYDKIISDFMRKYTKRWGGVVDQAQIKTADEREVFNDQYQRAEMLNEPNYEIVHSLSITPSMRDSILRSGQSLFGSSEGQPNEVTEAMSRLKDQQARKRRNPSLNELNDILSKEKGGELESKKDITNTPAFKKWFGKSVVVDENNDPLVVYHGTMDDFNQFEKGDIGYHFGTIEQAQNIIDTKMKGRSNRGESTEGGNIIPVYLSIQNPVRMEDAGDFASGQDLANTVRNAKIFNRQEMKILNRMVDNAYENFSDDPDTWELENQKIADWVRDKIKAKDYDGIVYENQQEGVGDSYIVFSPTQIKSTIGNKGTFDPDNPSILESIRNSSPEANSMITSAEIGLGKQMTGEAINRASRSGRTIRTLGKAGDAFLDYRSKSNRLYLNHVGEELLRMIRSNAYGEPVSNAYGVTLDVNKLKDLVKTTRQMQEPLKSYEAIAVLDDFESAFNSSIKKNEPLTIINAATVTGPTTRATAKHEEFHRVDLKIKSAFDGLTPDKEEMADLPHMQQLARRISGKMGYRSDPSIVAMEAAARIATGDNEELELTPEEELDFLKGYFTLMGDTYHENVLDQYKLITNAARKVRDEVKKEFESNKAIGDTGEGGRAPAETTQGLSGWRGRGSPEGVEASSSRAVEDSYEYLSKRISNGTLGNSPVEDSYHISLITGYESLKDNPDLDRDKWESGMIKQLGERARPHLDSVWDLISGKAPIFYSPVTNLITRQTQTKFSPEQLRGILKGISDDELKWSGLNDLLKEKERNKESITKQELLDHLAVNNISVKTITSGVTLKHLDWDNITDSQNEFRYATKDGAEYSYVITPSKSKSNPFMLIISAPAGNVVQTTSTNSLEAAKGLAESLRWDKKSPEEIAKNDIALLKQEGYDVDKTEDDGEPISVFFRKSDESDSDLYMVNDLPHYLQPAADRIVTVFSKPSDTRYSEYKLEGGKPNSYVEIKITLSINQLPNGWSVSEETTKSGVKRWEVRNNKGQIDGTGATKEEAIQASVRASGLGGTSYQSPHWDEPNVLAHIRGQEHEHTDGVDGFIIDESQSDYATDVRRKGVKLSPKEESDLVEERSRLIDEKSKLKPGVERDAIDQKLSNVRDQLSQNEKAQPSLPFLKQWPLLTVKQAIRHAVEQGLSRVSIVGARVHIDRWGTERAVWSKVDLYQVKSKSKGHVVDNVDIGAPVSQWQRTADKETIDKFLARVSDPEDAVVEKLENKGWRFQFKAQEGGNAGGINLEQEGLARGILLKESSIIVRDKEDVIREIKRHHVQNEELVIDKVWKEMQRQGDTGITWPRAEGLLNRYGEMSDYIQERFAKHNRPDLLKFAWDRPDGKQSESFMPIAFRDVGKAWKANVDINEITTSSKERGFSDYPDRRQGVSEKELPMDTNLPVYSLDIPSTMADAVIKTGQPLYGSSPDDPVYVLDAKSRMSPQGRKNIIDQGIVTGYQILSKENPEFKDWQSEMLRQLGESIRPHLDSIWSRLQEAKGIELESKRYSHPDKSLDKIVKEEYGITKDIMKAGYILHDGSMLDFSKISGEGDRKDHTDITRSTGASIDGFLNQSHAVRISASRDGSINVQFAHPLSDVQMKLIMDNVKGDHFAVDASNDDYPNHFLAERIEHPTKIEAARLLRRANDILSKEKGVELELKKDITKTPEFKEWFGKSKVLDKDGTPLILYHGTNKAFKYFSKKFIGTGSDEGFLGHGFSFTPHPRESENYPETANSFEGFNTRPVYIKMENPYVWDDSSVTKAKQQADLNKQSGVDFNAKPDEITDQLKAKGYDGIIFKTDFGGREYLVFEPDQIRSALSFERKDIELESKSPESDEETKARLSALFDDLVPPTPEPQAKTVSPKERGQDYYYIKLLEKEIAKQRAAGAVDPNLQKTYDAMKQEVASTTVAAGGGSGGSGSGKFYDAYMENAPDPSRKPSAWDVVKASNLTTPWRAPGKAFMEAINFFRAFMTAPGIAPARHSLVLATTNPLSIGTKAFAKGMKAAVSSKESFKKQMEELASQPDFEFTKKIMGIEYTGPEVHRREELFRSNVAELLPHVRSSSQSFVGTLNWVRYLASSMIAKELKEGVSWIPFVGQRLPFGRLKGVSPEEHPDVYFMAGRWINSATGRGYFGRYGQEEALMDLVNTGLFSARLQKGRIDLLNPWTYKKMPYQARNLTMRKMFEFSSLIFAMLALAAAAGMKVTSDIDDPDFGKIVSGNFHFDLTAGFASYIRLFALSARDVVHKDRQHLAKIWGHFLWNKLAPFPAAAVNLTFGKDHKSYGEPTSVGREVKDLMTPIFVQSLIKGYQDSGVSGAVLAGVPSLFHMGMEVYPPYTPEEKSPLSRKVQERKLEMLRSRYSDDPMSIEDKAKIEAENKIIEVLKKGDRDEAGKLFNDAVSKGLMASGEEKRIAKKADLASKFDSSTARLVYNMSAMPFEEQLDIFLDPDASKEERSAMAPYIADKYMSWMNQRADEVKDHKETVPKYVYERVLDKLEKAKKLGIVEMAQEKAKAASAK